MPVFGFGEVDLFDAAISSEGGRFQFIKRLAFNLIGSPGILKGTGIFKFLPFRRPLTTVGKEIE